MVRSGVGAGGVPMTRFRGTGTGNLHTGEMTCLLTSNVQKLVRLVSIGQLYTSRLSDYRNYPRTAGTATV